MKRLLLSSIAIFATFISSAQEVGVSKLTLTNGPVQMTIDVLHGGRITSFRYNDREVLSQLTWPESFGSTFWTSPQKEWNWPPVPEFDKAAYTVIPPDEAPLSTDTALETAGAANTPQYAQRLVIQSPVSPRLGLRVTKDFRIPAATTPLPRQGGDSMSPSFLVTYTITNEGTEPRRVAPWEITRVQNRDGLVFFDAPVDSIWPKELMTFTRQHHAAWYRTDQAPENRKVNADARGWLAYLADGLLLVKRFPDLAPTDPAPGEAEVQVYVNRGQTYIELESQGPYTLLPPGAALSWTVRWFLLPVDLPTEPSADLRKLLE